MPRQREGAHRRRRPPLARAATALSTPPLAARTGIQGTAVRPRVMCRSPDFPFSPELSDPAPGITGDARALASKTPENGALSTPGSSGGVDDGGMDPLDALSRSRTCWSEAVLAGTSRRRSGWPAEVVAALTPVLLRAIAMRLKACLDRRHDVPRHPARHSPGRAVPRGPSRAGRTVGASSCGRTLRGATCTATPNWSDGADRRSS